MSYHSDNTGDSYQGAGTHWLTFLDDFINLMNLFASEAERVEALALLGCPQRAVGRGFNPR